ncbi:MAG TPA: class I SAM-dependent RNA methyltransferase [Blastocatellia bacterium]|nr:class I SAM-dependent RNA methyltransferase [Blastocatellia bacterium]
MTARDQTGPDVGDVVEVTPDRIGYGGDAVARVDGLVVFIPFAAPGDRLRVRLIERRKHLARATIEEIISPSKLRRDPPCEYFGECGGCQLQHLNYDSQLEAKIGFVRDSLERIGHIRWTGPIEIEPSRELGYRSRARVQIDRRTGSVGFKRARSNSVCDITQCPVLSPELNDLLHQIRAMDLSASSRGLLSGEIEAAAGDQGVSASARLTGLPTGDLEIEVEGLWFSFSPKVFFQSNSTMLSPLVREVVGREGGSVAIDLYAGVGLFTIPMARSFDSVVAVEADDRTAAYARRNVARNGVTNVRVMCTTVQGASRQLGELGAGLIVLDPPRRGAAEAIPMLAAMRPERIVYVSCDPVTLSRDLRSLVEHGFELVGVKAFDLFPQTYHVETVARLVAGPRVGSGVVNSSD